MRLWKIVLPALLVTVSCSVREDRTECPLWVSVKAQTESDCLVSFYSMDGKLLENRMIAAEDMCSGNNRTLIGRRDFYVSFLVNKWNMSLLDGKVVCAEKGREAPPVYAFSLRRIIWEEPSPDEILIEGEMKKQHALVKVRFRYGEENGFPFFLKLSGRMNGFDLLTLEAEEGGYSIEPEMDESLCTEFILTRQRPEDPILLSLCDKTTGVEKAAFDIGEHISRAGYDWEAESLGDIDITVDCSKMEISVVISGWREEEIEIF